MIIFAFCLVSLFFLLQVSLILGFGFYQNPKSPPLTTFPKITILLAVRNEENNILNCLNSLIHLDYPKEKLEILIGNDQSTDNTATLVQNYIQDKPYCKLIHITTQLGNAKGKANVLAHLAKLATGEVFFITDADMQLPAQWIKSMLAHLDKNTGIVTGVTCIESGTLWQHWQAIDWLMGLGVIQALANLGKHFTTMGNNMLVTRKAYEAVGGYENLPFSWVEDFILAQEVKKRGFGLKNIMQIHVLAWTKPVSNFIMLLQQRKRWMQEGKKLPFLIIFILIINFLLWITIGVMAFIAPYISLILFLSKYFLCFLFLFMILRKLKQLHLLKYYLFYEFYACGFNFLLLIFYLLPIKINWKGRNYT